LYYQILIERKILKNQDRIGKTKFEISSPDNSRGKWYEEYWNNINDLGCINNT